LAPKAGDEVTSAAELVKETAVELTADAAELTGWRTLYMVVIGMSYLTNKCNAA